jgi:hypothetical protein
MGGIVIDYIFEGLKRISFTDPFDIVFLAISRMNKSSVYINHNFILQWNWFYQARKP